jgi:hypothetical protein
VSPILDLQRRHSTVFRLRMGEKVIASNGKERPSYFADAIRVTSADSAVVDAFVAVYGGERQPWEKQWQATLPTNKLPITLLPGQSITQWWEKWKGATCARRCDGYEQTTGEPCVCPSDIDARMAGRDHCSPTTRLSVLCPEVEVLGAGMLVSHGRIAAEQLPSSVQVAEAALARGIYVPAMLVIQEMVSAGQRWVTPDIHITGISLVQLQSGQIAQPAIEGPARSALPAESRPQVEQPKGGGGVGGGHRPPPPPAQPSLRQRIEQLDEDLRGRLADDWQAAGLPDLETATTINRADKQRAVQLVERYERQAEIVRLLDEHCGDDREAMQSIVAEVTGGAGFSGTAEEVKLLRMRLESE